MKCKALRVFAITLLSFSCIPITAQLKQSQPGRGDEWLSWHPEQRQGYVYGYVDGYLMGYLGACHVADHLFEKGKAHTLGGGKLTTDTPFARCIVRRGEFSKLLSDKNVDKEGHLDVSIYTAVITDFYERHGGCRDYPFSMLMEHLASKYSTADELYEAAKQGLLKGRSRQWCGLDTPPADK